ncbi:MAG: DUF1080 domain-containing protein [Candidatus Hydrogenedentes bacterium]|nr:DUF1080 domain-containing protein [Candidatus Hydrogenedentota bacterium]
MRNGYRVMAIVLLAAVCVSMSAVADEWINLFDKESLYGWTQFGQGNWSVADGNLVCDSGAGGWLASTSQFADFELVVKMRVEADGAAGLAFRAGLEGHPSENGSNWLTIAEPKGSTPDWHVIKVTANGTNVAATVDGKDANVLGGGRARGYIGILYYHKGKVMVESARLRPLNMKPIFNGKDLSGWNAIPEHKSVFSVVDGALNIKNGNGQIETAGTYKDFFFQADVFSNGDHLNSGIFFHGPVGIFWKGYEAQIRNQWEGDDRTKPVDFGTGGNYGNQPARKVVSSDREWFTYTIVCDGNHASLWLNGYLTSDFLDVRPQSLQKQGKEGYVPGPGTIHLQGHDPTTDLSFKNIVLQEYPAK